MAGLERAANAIREYQIANCVEVGALSVSWRKSSGSAGANGGSQCVEVGATPHRIGIRDSKLGETSPQLWLDPSDFTGLLTQLRTETF